MWTSHGIKTLPCMPHLSSSTPLSNPPKAPCSCSLSWWYFLKLPADSWPPGPNEKYNNWGWVVVRAVRNPEVSLDGTTVKDKLLKSSACDYTEGICFYTKHSMAEALAGWECGCVQSGVFGPVSVVAGGWWHPLPKTLHGVCCLNDLLLIRDGWAKQNK